MAHTIYRQLTDSQTGTIPNTMPHRATRALEVPFRGIYERSRPSLLFYAISFSKIDTISVSCCIVETNEVFQALYLCLFYSAPKTLYTGGSSMNKTLLGLTLTAIATTTMLGCNKTEEGAAWGAGIGALAGQAIGGDTGGTLIGAGVGAIVGGAIGNDQEQQQQRQHRQQQADGSTIHRTTIHETLNPDGTVTRTGTTTTTSSQTSDGYTGLED